MPEPRQASGAAGGQTVATFEAGAADMGVTILSPKDNAELESGGQTLDVPVGLSVAGVDLGTGAYGLRFWLDGELVGLQETAAPFVFEAVPHGRRHLLVEVVELLSGVAEPVPGVRASIHVRVASPCLDAAECDDGLVCSTHACIAGRCRYGGIPACCDQDLECPWGAQCAEGACVECESAADCDDGDPCTDDGCVDGECESALAAGCCASDDDCDDADWCTTDVCGPGGCDNVPVGDPGCCNVDGDCAPAEPGCAVFMCYVQITAGLARCRYGPPPAGCCVADAECDDAHPCTLDICELGAAGVGQCV